MENSLNVADTDKLTNQDIFISYTPDSSVANYEYKIIKDSKVIKNVNITENKKSEILLSESGIYQVKITEYYNDGNKKTIINKYIIDKDPPKLEVGDNLVNLKQNHKINIMGNVKAIDNVDGDITSLVTTNESELDFTKIGSNKLIYSVSDSAGNRVTKTVIVNVVPDNTNQLLISQGLIILSLIILLVYIIIYNRGLKIEKRLTRYSVKPIKDKSRSFFGNVFRFIDSIIEIIEKFLSKSVFIKKMSKRYKKYVKVFGKEGDTATTFIAQKIVLGIVFLGITIIAKTIRLQVLYLYEIIIPIFIGYYTLDIIYAYRYRKYRKLIENDFLQAIIIMNNAFKSGRSITQAIDLVSEELDGPLSEEFKKIALEISFGLDLEIVFKRFAERINIDEAAYLTASLSITNRTGGNIIRVFNSIEKTLFNRKKLKLELKSLTSSSKMIMYVLMVVPLFFVLIISMINPTYFAPLFANSLGLILIFIMLVIYITYIIIVRKIINIRM